MAVLGGDVMGGAAADHADMHRGKRRLEHRGELGWLGLHILGVHLVGPLDQLGPRHDRIDTGMQQAGVDLEADHMGIETGAALVSRHRLHARRLTHDHRAALGHHALHRRNHRRRAGAAYFLVEAQRNLQGALHARMMRLYQRPDRQRVESLHVAGAAPVVFAVLLHHGERVRVPGLSINGHHIRMAGQHNGPLHLWPRMREQRVLGLLGVDIPVRGDAVTV